MCQEVLVLELSFIQKYLIMVSYVSCAIRGISDVLFIIALES